MNPISFDSANMRLLPPPSDPTVDPVAAYRTDDRTVTVWKPTPEEIKALVDGAHILLHVYSAIHPPVYLTVQKMNETEGSVHALADMSQTRCGVDLKALPVMNLWTNHKERVTCPRCRS